MWSLIDTVGVGSGAAMAAEAPPAMAMESTPALTPARVVILGIEALLNFSDRCAYEVSCRARVGGYSNP